MSYRCGIGEEGLPMITCDGCGHSLVALTGSGGPPAWRRR